MPKDFVSLEPYTAKGCPCQDCTDMKPHYNAIVKQLDEKHLDPVAALKMFMRLAVATVVEAGNKDREDTFDYWDSVRQVTMEVMSDALSWKSDGQFAMEVQNLNVVVIDDDGSAHTQQ